MNTLSFYRIKYLFNTHFIANWQKDVKNFLIVFATSIFFIFYDLNLIMPVIFILSILYARGSEKMLGNKNAAANYLLLPTNTSEKWLVNFILTHLYYPVTLILVAALGIFFSRFFLTASTVDVSYFSISCDSIISWVVLLSMTMFASIYFKKHTIAKLLAIFAVLVVVFLIFIRIFTNVIFVSQMQFIFYSDVLRPLIFSGSFLRFSDILWTVSKLVAIVFFWVLSYFRLRETEV